MNRKSMTQSEIVLERTLTTALGSILCGAVRSGICVLEFAGNERAKRSMSRAHRLFSQDVDAVNDDDAFQAASLWLDQLQTEMDEYFGAERERFEVPVVLRGTEFQMRVWSVLTETHIGDMLTYTELADRAGRPEAIRASAAANGANPISLLVPCHRVVSTTGALTGYSGGLDRKRALLDLERSYCEQHPTLV